MIGVTLQTLGNDIVLPKGTNICPAFYLSCKDIKKIPNVPLIWKCLKGHTFVESVSERIKNKLLCPICKEEKSNKHNIENKKAVQKTRKSINNNTATHTKISVGSNIKTVKDLINSKLSYRYLGKEWTGISATSTSRKKFNIESTDINSKELLFWKCSKGHKFCASPNLRIHEKSQCPICSNKSYTKGSEDTRKEVYIWRKWSNDLHSEEEIREQILAHPYYVCTAFLLNENRFRPEFMQEFLALSTFYLTDANYSKRMVQKVIKTMDFNLGIDKDASIKDIIVDSGAKSKLKKLSKEDHSKKDENLVSMVIDSDIVPHLAFETFFSSQNNIPIELFNKYKPLLKPTFFAQSKSEVD